MKCHRKILRTISFNGWKLENNSGKQIIFFTNIYPLLDFEWDAWNSNFEGTLPGIGGGVGAVLTTP